MEQDNSAFNQSEELDQDEAKILGLIMTRKNRHH
jgi:hypothetical protein